MEHGIFDALAKKYLDTVYLEIYQLDAPEEDDPLANGPEGGTQNAESSPLEANEQAGKRRLLEVFSFSVSYPSGDEPELRVSRGRHPCKRSEHSRESVKQRTCDVLRHLVRIASSLQPLPEDRIISVKLIYTKDTPSSYEPPMFRPATAVSVASWFENRPLRMNAGKIETSHHEMSFLVRSVVDVRRPQEIAEGEMATSSGSTSSDSETTRPLRLGQRRQAQTTRAASRTDHGESRVVLDAGSAADGNSCRADVGPRTFEQEGPVIMATQSERSPETATDPVPRSSGPLPGERADEHAPRDMARHAKPSSSSRTSAEHTVTTRMRLRLRIRDESPVGGGSGNSSARGSRTERRAMPLSKPSDQSRCGKLSKRKIGDVQLSEAPTVLRVPSRKVSEPYQAIRQASKRRRDGSLSGTKRITDAEGLENVSTCI